VTDEAKEPASPACLAHEAGDAYMGFATPDEIAAFLNEFLEAERVCAAKLRAMLPKVRDDALHRDLAEMLHAHETNIARAVAALGADR